MKRVAIVNGVARQFKYNQFLAKKYAEMGFEAKEFKFSPFILFSHHLRKNLLPEVKDIVDNHDVIHCQSGGYFPVLEYYVDNSCKKPFILETPVVKSCTGTLFVGANLSKTYDVPDNVLVQKGLDFFCFQPAWVSKMMTNLAKLKKSNQTLMLASLADTVSDIRGREDLFHHIFSEGKHARLFNPVDGVTNDFDKIVKKFVENHKYFQHK